MSLLELEDEHGVEDTDKGDGYDEADGQRVDDVQSRWRARAFVACRYVYDTAVTPFMHHTHCLLPIS